MEDLDVDRLLEYSASSTLDIWLFGFCMRNGPLTRLATVSGGGGLPTYALTVWRRTGGDLILIILIFRRAEGDNERERRGGEESSG